MGSSSSKTPAPPVAPPPAAAEPSKKDEALKFGWEEKNYGGAYVQKTPLRRQLSSEPDEMAIWRLEARSLRLMEMFLESDEALAKRPFPHETRLPQNLDLNSMVTKACHRRCSELWSAYDRCTNKKNGSHDKCTGWYQTYMNCFDSCSPRLVLNVLETMAEHDPDPNMDRLRR